LGFYFFQKERETLEKRLFQEIKNDLYLIALNTKPTIQSDKFFSGLLDEIFSRQTPTPLKIEKIIKTKKHLYPENFEIYVFDQNGKLIKTSASLQPRANLVKKIWNISGAQLLKNNTLNHKTNANLELSSIQQIMKSKLDVGFSIHRFINHREQTMKLAMNKIISHLYWDIDSKSKLGGAIFINNSPPRQEDYFESNTDKFNNRKQTYIVRFKDKHKKIFQYGQKIPQKTVEFLQNRFVARPNRHIIYNGFIWVRLQTLGLDLIKGKKIESIVSPSTQYFLLVTWLCSFFTGTFLLYRWVVLEKDFSISITFKLIFLFVFAVFIPILGLLFTTNLLMQLEHYLKEEECGNTAKAVIQEIDSSPVEEINRYSTQFKKLSNLIKNNKDLKEFKSYAKKLYKQRLFEVCDLRALNGETLFTVDKKSSEQLGPEYNGFIYAAIHKHLKRRIADNQQNGPPPLSAKITNLVFYSNSKFPLLLQVPDQIDTCRVLGPRTLFYWNIFHDSQKKPAILVIAQKDEWFRENIFNRKLNERKSFDNGQFRLVARSLRFPIWYPTGKKPNNKIRDLMTRAEIGQKDFSQKIQIDGKKYLAFVFLGNYMRNMAFLALYPEEVITRKLDNFKYWTIAGITFILLTSICIGFLLSASFLIPIDDMKKGLQAINNRNTNYRMSLFSRDEFGNLALFFNQMMENLDELNMGSIVQKKLLPQEALELNGYVVYGLSSPATDLGGDYFDYHKIEDHSILLLIGDVTGHGVPAALIMAMAKATIQEGIQSKKSIAEMAQGLNLTIFSTMEKTFFFSCTFLLLNTIQNTIETINFGHPFPYRYSKDQKLSLESVTPNYPLGIRNKIRLIPHYTRLQSEEKLIYYTDGLVESLDDDPDINAFDSFGLYLQKYCSLQVKPLCENALANHPFVKTGKTQPDDFTLLVISRTRS
jgi:hypothetical protein